MALSVSLSADMTPHGAAFPNAYARIVGGTWSRRSLVYQVAIYASAEARQADAEPVRVEQLEVETDDLLSIADLYEDAKSRPQFAGATDA